MPFVHEKALVNEGGRIGAGSRVWDFAHILEDAVLGEDCNICDHTFVEGAVRLGNRVTVKSGVYLGDGVIFEDDVFVGQCAVFTNDLRPRSQKRAEHYPITILRRGSG